MATLFIIAAVAFVGLLPWLIDHDWGLAIAAALWVAFIITAIRTRKNTP